MVSPGNYLNIEVKPDNQKKLKAVTKAIVGGNITDKRKIVRDAFGSSDKMKIPKHMLDQFALIKPHSGIVKSEPNLKGMKSK